MAGLVNFTPIQASDSTLQRIQLGIQKAIGQFTSNMLLTGILRSVTFTAVDSDVSVPHNFNSTQVSFLVGGASLPAMIFKSPVAQTANQLILRCEQTSTVSAANTITAKNPLTCMIYPFLVG